MVPAATSNKIWSSPITGNDWLLPTFWNVACLANTGYVVGTSTLFRCQLPARAAPNLINDSSGGWLSFSGDVAAVYTYAGYALAWNSGTALST